MRPHIEFIQHQWLPFEPRVLPHARPDLDARVLSRDTESGACSLILRYPAGWSRAAECLAVDEELLVLEGALEIGDVSYQRHDYAHLPRGLGRAGMHSGNGALVLTFFSAAAVARRADTSDYDPARLVRHLNTRTLPAQIGPRKHMRSAGFNHGGTVHKLLFDDPLTGDKTWLAGLGPWWHCETQETHPVAEEEFALAGDIHMPNGVLREGGYFWRPPDIAHGPFGTIGGTVHLCRGKGGVYSTVFTPAPRPFAWDPVYRPVVPDQYRRWIPLELLTDQSR